MSEKRTILILLAEDKEYMQSLIKDYIYSNPTKIIKDVEIEYEIDIVSSAEEAILKYVAAEHDIVIMDLSFGDDDLTGIHATEEILEVNTNLNIIGMASEGDINVEQFKNSGIRYFLEKPFQDAYLWNKIDTIIEELLSTKNLFTNRNGR